jgi:multiple sugar transport system permease protein
MTARSSLRQRLGRLALHVTAYGLVGAFLFPFLWMLICAFKDKAEVNALPPTLLFTPTLVNFRNVVAQAKFWEYALNSAVIAVAATLLGLVLGLPAAYSIARYKQHRLALVILLSRILPGISYLVPWFILFTKLRMMGSYSAMTLTHLIIVLPLIVWVMVGFFEDLPVEMEEAARIDGTTLIGYLVRVAIPLTKPGIAATAILSFIFSWNNFLFSLIIGGEGTRTLPVAVFNFISYAQIDWGGVNAAATLITLPVVLMVMAAQKHIVRGLAMGGVKG